MGTAISAKQVPATLKNAEVGVATDKSFYNAGETVYGYVQVTVSEPMPVQNVYVSLSGLASTVVTYYKTHGTGENRKRKRHTARQTDLLYQITAKVAAFPSKVSAAGSFRFPFTLQVPANAAPSISCTCGERNKAYITHKIGVTLDGVGTDSGKQYPVHNTIITVAGAITKAPSQPFTEDIQAVNFFGCFSQGFIKLGFRASSDVFRNGDSGQVTFQVANNSTTEVSLVLLELFEECYWEAHGHSRITSRPIKTLNIYGKIEKGVGFGAGATPPSPPLTVPIDIPWTAHGSVECSLVKVSYTMRVTVRTGTCITDPCVTVPVFIHRQRQGDAPLVYDYGGMAEDLEMAVPFSAAIAYDHNWQNGNQGQYQASPAAIAGVPVDTTGNGLADAIGFDYDGDGQIDAVGYDIDGDGRVDKIHPIMPSAGRVDKKIHPIMPSAPAVNLPGQPETPGLAGGFCVYCGAAMRSAAAEFCIQCGKKKSQ